MNKNKYTLKGYIAKLDEYEDDGVALFSKPQGDSYTYGDKEDVDIIQFLQDNNVIGKKVKITIEVLK